MKKTLLPLLLTACFALANCSSAKEEATAAAATETPAASEPTADEATASEATATDEAEPAAETASANSADGDCSKFLNDYEEFAASYAALAAKYAKDPTDMSIVAEYGEMAAKAQVMQQTTPEACQSDAAFVKRYTAIAAKVTHAAAAQMQGSAKMLEQMGQ